MKRLAFLGLIALIISAGTGYYWWSTHAYPKLVSGPNSNRVLSLIRAVDRGDTEELKAVPLAAYEYGVAEDRKQRKAKITDIPGSVHADIPGGREECRLLSIEGYESIVAAKWQCPCCDRGLDRKFHFSGARLVKISNWHEFIF
ncbi:hypothetical protein WG908_00200 [Sphingobium sp. AN641]|uniref:hypothetical protein n=1 Tax=Sphingobium sp. AN641 TaxID=3133443 RepID=UPI0030C58F76